MPAFVLYESAFSLLLAALVLAGAYLALPRPLLLRASLACAGLAALVHAAFLAVSWADQGVLPLVSNFGSLSFLAFALTLVFVAVEWRYRLGILGIFILPIPALFMLMGYRFKNLAAPPSPLALQDLYLACHVALSMLAFAFFTTASGVAAAYLVQHRQLKARSLGRTGYQLPSLEELERLSFQCVGLGLAALSAGLLAGVAWSLKSFGRILESDPKVWGSLFLWVVYALLLGLKMSGRFRGRKPALALVLGFLVFFFGYYLVNVYGGGHKFLN